MALNFLSPGSPNNQPLVGDLHTAKSAIFVGVLNGIAWSSYLQPCLCDDDGASGNVEQRYCLYQLANYLRTMLGVALLVVGMAFSATVISSPVLTQVAKYVVWMTKVLTGATLLFGLSVLHSCLRMWGKFMLL